jgi:hypothetical protein
MLTIGKRVLRSNTDLPASEVESEGCRWYLRMELRGACHRVLQAAGVAVPPLVRVLWSRGWGACSAKPPVVSGISQQGKDIICKSVEGGFITILI